MTRPASRAGTRSRARSGGRSGSRDRRSVGELLADADRTARQILYDVDVLDGRAMVRTWPEVVEAAGDARRALPSTAGRDPLAEQRPPDLDDVLMDRLQGMTTTLTRGIRATHWPGDGPHDEQLLQIAENLTRAADLLARHRVDRQPMRAEVRADLDAAKARLMHTLYVAAHGVSVVLGRDARHVEGLLRAKSHIPPGHSLTGTRGVRERVAAFEQLAGSYVAHTHPRALSGIHREDPDVDRLAQALARWDVHAHRALATGGTAATLAQVTATEAVIVFHAQGLLRAAAHTGRIDRGHFEQRLAPALEAAHEHWLEVAAAWRGLVPPSARRFPPPLEQAAHEARAALHEILHGHATLATPEVVAARTDLARTAQTIHLAITASADLAHATRGLVASEHLTVAARAAQAVVNDVQAHPTPSTPRTDAAVVSPAQHARNDPIAIPDIVRDHLLVHHDRVVAATAAAVSAAAILHGRIPDTPSATPRRTGRTTENHSAPRLETHRPGPPRGR